MGMEFNPSKCSVLQIGCTNGSDFYLETNKLQNTESMNLLGIQFHKKKSPTRDASTEANTTISKISFILSGKVPVPTKLGTTLWISKVSPTLLYDSEIFPLGEKEI